jgi:putative DeoR family transcriptional regulator (stage III sporulation protein D)
MRDTLIERVLLVAKRFLNIKDATVRSIALDVGVSKSAIYNDLVLRLKLINDKLYRRAKLKLAYNKKMRHIRGGSATRRKFIK